MPTSRPPETRQTTWQLPWLRMSLILRRMAAEGRSSDAEIAELTALRDRIARRGWFN